MEAVTEQLGWWDRGMSEQGELIRTDVRVAAHEIWESARRRTAALLGDDADAAELMEGTVLSVSRYLNRSSEPASRPNLHGLLMVAFMRELNRHVARLRRMEPSGSAVELESEISDWSWAQNVETQLDISRLLDRMSEQSKRIWALREEGYGWSELARLLGISIAGAKSSFWRDLKRAAAALGLNSGIPCERRRLSEI